MQADWIYGYAVRSEEGAFHAYCSAAPEAIASGVSPEAAAREMGEALIAAVRARMKLGDELVPPAPPRFDEQRAFALPLALAIKATVYAAWRASPMSKVALGAILDLNEKEVRRILDPDHPTGVERMSAAAAVLGVELVVGRRMAA